MSNGITFIGLLVVCVCFFAVRFVVRLVRVQSSAPRCGHCQYELAPNPEGLTRCPECGGDFLKVGITTATTRGEMPPTEAGVAAALGVAVGIVGFMLYFLVSSLWPFQKVATNGSSVFEPVIHARSSLPAHTATLDFDLTYVAGRPAQSGTLTLTIQSAGGPKKAIALDASTGLVTSADLAGASRVGSPVWPTMVRDLYLEAGFDTSKDPNFALAADAVQAEVLATLQSPGGTGNRAPNLAAVPNGGLARRGGGGNSILIGAVVPIGNSDVPLWAASLMIVAVVYAIVLRFAIRARRRALAVEL